jgi:hypothetical protein
MRTFRAIVGVTLALAGLAAALAGGLAAFWLIGPDDTFSTSEQHVAGTGLAIVSAPDLIEYTGPVLHLGARTVSGRPVFIGVAREFDAASYVKGANHLRLVQLDRSLALHAERHSGALTPLTPPARLDWWVAKVSGPGTQTLVWPIADGPYDVVIMNADGKPAADAQVTVGVEVDGAYKTALLVFGVGMLLLVAGVLLAVIRRRRPVAPDVPPVQYPPQYPAQQWSPPGSYQRTARRIVATGLVLALTAGCAAVPQKRTVTTLSRPAVTEAAATAVVKHYNAVANKAAAQRNDSLAAQVETGPALEQTRARQLIGRVRDKNRKQLPKPVMYLGTDFGAPAYSGYPMSFVTNSGVSTNASGSHLGVWRRESAGGPWKLSYSITTSSSLTWAPALTGLRVARPADVKRLRVPPKAIAARLAQYLTGGAKSPRAAEFTSPRAVDDLLAQLARRNAADRKDSYIASVSDRFTVRGQPIGFVATTGEMLIFVTLTERYDQKLRANSYAYWARGDVLAFSPGDRRYNHGLTNDTLYQFALLVPRDRGSIRVLAYDAQLVDAGGY